MLEENGIDARFEKASDPSFHTGRCAAVTAGGKHIGTIGELHPTVSENYGVKERIYIAELDIAEMCGLANNDIKYRQLPKFPAITRDLSLVCDDDVTSGEIIDIITKAGKHLEQVTLFDMYKGTGVPDGKKSLSYSIVMRREDKTMEAEEADKSVEKILKALGEKNITLR